MRQTFKQIERQTDEQTDRQTERQTDFLQMPDENHIDCPSICTFVYPSNAWILSGKENRKEKIMPASQTDRQTDSLELMCECVKFRKFMKAR